MIRRFNRYELKYLISSRTRDAMLPTLLAYMRPDAEGAEDGRYEVTSLYHDTWDLACYRAKIDGINYRRKLRIRRYGRSTSCSTTPVMVEIKQRINRTTQKRRLLLPLSEAYQLCEGVFDRTFENPLDEEVKNEVQFLSGAQQLRPKCVIAYRRRALVGSRYEPGLRITFDEDLSVSDVRCGLLDGAPRYRFLPPDRIVLEVKTNDVVPLWVSRLLAAHSCGVVRFSKYCAGVRWLATRRGEWNG